MLFHFLIARKHGESAAYPVAVAFDDAGFLAVNDKYRELSGPGAAAFGAENAEILFATVDNDALNIRHWHIFPDPAAVEKSRKAKALEAALALRQANERAQKEVENAQALVEETSSKLESLSSDDLVTLAEYDAEQARIAEAHAKEEADKAAAIDLNAEEREARDHAQREAADKSATEATAALTEAIAAPTPSEGTFEVVVSPVSPVTPEPSPKVDGPALPLP